MAAPETNLSPASLFDVEGRSALITGATGALGAVAARALSEAGAKLTLTGGNSDQLEQLGAELGDDVELVAKRPETEADTDAMVKAAVKAHGRVDILLTAAGLNKTSPIQEQPVEDWETIMDGNVRGSWLAARSAGRQMLEQGEGGRVVLVS